MIAVLPGIPPAGSAEANAFWMAFYAGLYSGILYSLVTGVIVGLIVLVAQRRGDARRYRAGLEREVSLAREQMRAVLLQPEPFMIADDAAICGSQAARVITDSVVQGQPIDLWTDHLPRNRHFFDALRRLQATHGRLLVTANAVNLHLRNLIRIRLREWRHCFDGERIKFILARIRGCGVKEILPWIQAPGLNTERALLDTYDSVEANGSSQAVFDAYLEAIKAERESAEILRRLLNSATPQQTTARLPIGFLNVLSRRAAEMYERTSKRLLEEWKKRWRPRQQDPSRRG